MSNATRLRGNAKRRSGPYPLGEIPHSVVTEIGKHLVHRLAVGQVNITGDDFGGIFASAIGGQHRSSPLGIADVEWEDCAWSVKTVQDSKPFAQTRIRTISGRNSPFYSHGITDHSTDLQATGRSVLEIWNARVDEAANQYDDLRIVVLIRNMSTLEFNIMEHAAVRFIPTDYLWSKNRTGNLEAKHTTSGEHCFTWQPTGGQFTVIHHVPRSSYLFRIGQKPGVLEESHVLKLVNYDDSWIQAVQRA